MSNSLLSIATQRNLTMTSRQVTDYLNQFNDDAGIETRFRHDNVKRTIETLAKQGAIKSPQFEEIPTATKPVVVFVFEGDQGKRDCITLVAQLSPLHTARIVDRWLELENSAPNYALLPAKMLAESTLLECAARVMNLAPSAVQQGMRFIAHKNGLDADLIPAYVDDGQDVAHSATELLATHNIGITAAVFNKRLEQYGILCKQERKSTSKRAVNGIRSYWNVTTKGMKYGKNLSHEKSAGRETQPFWYDDKFHELLTVVGMA